MTPSHTPTPEAPSSSPKLQRMHTRQLNLLFMQIFESSPLIVIPLASVLAGMLWFIPLTRWRMWTLGTILCLPLLFFPLSMLILRKHRLEIIPLLRRFIPFGLLIHAVFITFSGGFDSPFFPLFLATPIFAGIFWRDLRLAAPIPLLATLLIATIGVLQWTGILPTIAGLGPQHPHPVGMLSKGFFMACGAWFSTAFSASVASRFERVAQQLDSTREELVEGYQERLRTLELLSRQMAHEVKNPLAAIKGLTQLLQRDGDPSGHLKVIAGEVQRLQELLDGFLTFSPPIAQLQLKPLSLPHLVDEIVQVLDVQFQEEHITVEQYNADEIPTIQGDLLRLKQVVFNLCLNAIEAIRSAPGTHHKLSLSFSTQNQGVSLQVTDSGEGFPPEFTSDNFAHWCKPHTSTKPSGSGLGLAISLSIIKAHSGTLTLSNPPEGGASVTCWLPLQPGPSPTPHPVPSPGPSPDLTTPAQKPSG